ncbi:Hypothetical predicted protein, partial [Paramuricea clavata]
MSETNASTALETKLFQLQLTTKRTDGILAKSEEEPIARHQGTLRTVIGEVENLRLTVEAEKLGRKEDTTEWSEEIDTKISEADSHVRLTKEWLAENKRKLEEMENDEKIKFERLNPPRSAKRDITRLFVILTTTRPKSEAVFPVVVVEVNGIRCRALIDSGAGSSYVSAKLIDLLKLKPSQSQIKNIDMLMASKTSKLEIYDMKFDSLDGSFSLPVRATKVNKSELLLIDNPKYPKLINQHPHLTGVTMNDDDVKDTLPVHVILGSGEYAKIKTQTRPRIGDEKAPIAELTKFDLPRR